MADKPLGVILAGGQSSRMGGGDKSLLSLGDQSLLAHVTARLAPQVGSMALNANGDPTRFVASGLPVIHDSIAGFAGPLAGVLAGLDWAADQGAAHIVTVAADTPFFPTDLTGCLITAARKGQKPIALAASPGPEGKIYRHPTFGLWPVTLRDDLRRALQDGLRKVVLWTDRHGTALAEFPVAGIDPFFNVNTPDDLAEARRLLREGTP
jgi:molybdopterin-guanine dinucleotide biosynthesis protein A